MVTRIRGFNGSTLTVDSTGPDDALGLANGQWVEITPQADRVLNSAGVAIFSVKDLNKNKITRYRAVVDETDDSAAAQSQVLRRR